MSGKSVNDKNTDLEEVSATMDNLINYLKGNLEEKFRRHYNEWGYKQYNSFESLSKNFANGFNKNIKESDFKNIESKEMSEKFYELCNLIESVGWFNGLDNGMKVGDERVNLVYKILRNT